MLLLIRYRGAGISQLTELHIANDEQRIRKKRSEMTENVYKSGTNQAYVLTVPHQWPHKLCNCCEWYSTRNDRSPVANVCYKLLSHDVKLADPEGDVKRPYLREPSITKNHMRWGPLNVTTLVIQKFAYDHTIMRTSAILLKMNSTGQSRDYYPFHHVNLPTVRDNCACSLSHQKNTDQRAHQPGCPHPATITLGTFSSSSIVVYEFSVAQKMLLCRLMRSFNLNSECFIAKQKQFCKILDWPHTIEGTTHRIRDDGRDHYRLMHAVSVANNNWNSYGVACNGENVQKPAIWAQRILPNVVAVRRMLCSSSVTVTGWPERGRQRQSQ